jgi:hypothetical protein
MLWSVRHRHCLRFVRWATVRDLLRGLAGSLPTDEPCEDCEQIKTESTE